MKRWIGSVVALACLAFPAASWSTTIYSTFGPGESFDPTQYIPINFYTSPEIIGTSLAFAFDVPGGSDFRLDGVRIAASWAGTKKNAQFSIFADVSGLPSTAPLVQLAENPDALGATAAVVWLPSASPTSLAAGMRYWLVVQPASLDSSSPADDFVELWLGLGATGLQTSRVSFDSGPWGDWFASPFEAVAPAFSIEASAIPEPGTLVLLATALLLLRGCGLRRE
jgi:hypothetical protein